MTLDFGDVSWLGVLVATVVYMVMGGLWYGPLFGKQFIRATGYSPPGEGEGPGPGIYIAPAIAYLIASIATALLAAATGSDTLSEGLILGLVVGVGYALTLTLVSVTFTEGLPEPMTLFTVTGLYNLIALVITGILVSVL
jgi:hypothetical protein